LKVFEDEIAILQSQVKESNFSSCSMVADNHTRFCILSDEDDLTFINEILNDIFRDVSHLVTEYQLEKDSLNDTKEKINATLGSILENFKKRDDAGLYESLRALRLIASKLQLQCWHTKTPTHTGPHITVG
jgi:hypothetical protein